MPTMTAIKEAGVKRRGSRRQPARFTQQQVFIKTQQPDRHCSRCYICVLRIFFKLETGNLLTFATDSFYIYSIFVLLQSAVLKYRRKVPSKWHISLGNFQNSDVKKMMGSKGQKKI